MINLTIETPVGLPPTEYTYETLVQEACVSFNGTMEVLFFLVVLMVFLLVVLSVLEYRYPLNKRIKGLREGVLRAEIGFAVLASLYYFLVFYG